MESPIVEAVLSGDEDLLLERWRLFPNFRNLLSSDGRLPLTAAVKCGNIQFVQRLLTLGANINEYDGVHETPLIVAIHQKNLLLVQYLLDRSADFRKTDILKNTPAQIAQASLFVEGLECISRRAQDNKDRIDSLIGLLARCQYKNPQIDTTEAILRQGLLLHSSSGILRRSILLSNCLANSTATPSQSRRIVGYEDVISHLKQADDPLAMIHNLNHPQNRDLYSIYTDSQITRLYGIVIVPSDLQ